jgi:anthranilate phosphoribosyltransferase
MNMKDILGHLFEHKQLSRKDAKEVLLNISHAQYNPAQVASFITVYQMRPVSIPELQGFRDALLELCVPLDLGGLETIDIVGTGGDNKNTFNISTLSSVVVAGAGYKVSKHGSYGVSSSVGSSNVLMALGYEFTNQADHLKRQLDEANICFLHAPLFHPALKEVVPIRKELGMRTFFNILGPLVNPVQPSHQLLGTSNMTMSRMYQYIMQESGRRFSIVYSLDGYDEVSLTGAFKLRSNEMDTVLKPEDIGRPRLAPQSLHGGNTPEEAARIFTNVLKGESTMAQQEVVIANAGLAIHCINPQQSMADCMAEARDSILSKKALQTFLKLVN